jgi:hypothetical protein
MTKFVPCNGGFDITTVLERFLILPLIYQALLRRCAFLGISGKFEENCFLRLYVSGLGRNILPKRWQIRQRMFLKRSFYTVFIPITVIYLELYTSLTFHGLVSDENLFCFSEDLFLSRSNGSSLYSLLFYKSDSWVLFWLNDASKSFSYKCSWPYTEGTWLYCDYFIWRIRVSRTVVVLTCFVMCGCFDNCVGDLVRCVLILIVFFIVCTVFLYCIFYVYLFLFVLSVLV